MYWVHVSDRLPTWRNPPKPILILYYFLMCLSYLFYAGLASNYCALYFTIPLGMFRSALTYKAGEVRTFLGECLIKFKAFLCSWGWHHTDPLEYTKRAKDATSGKECASERVEWIYAFYTDMMTSFLKFQIPNLLTRTKSNCCSLHWYVFICMDVLCLQSALILNISGNKTLLFR